MVHLTPIPETETTSDLYAITVNGTPALAYAARVSAMPFNTPWRGHQRPLDQTEETAFLCLCADEPVTVAVSPVRPVSDATVRPLSAGISPKRQGSAFLITLPGPGQYVFEGDNFHHALHIFVDPVREALPAKEGRTWIRYAPGVHHIGHTVIGSHTTVIIERGAVVYGSITAYGEEDILLCGGGILDGSEEIRTDDDRLLPCDYHAQLPGDREAFFAFLKQRRVLHGCLRLYRCRNVRVQDLVLRDSATFAMIPAQCENLEIDGIKTIGMWRYNADGIDLFNCRNVVIRNCFLRNFDDCVVIKGICGWDDWNNENILTEKCVVFCDWGRGLELGAETNAPEYRNIIFRDCDLIHGSTIHLDIQHHNRAYIHHILFENIRIEYNRHQLSEMIQERDEDVYTDTGTLRQPMLIAIPIYDMGLFSEDGLHGRVSDVLFRNIGIYTDGCLQKPVIQLNGLSPECTVSRVQIENITLNGKRLGETDTDLHIGPFTSDISFR